MDNKIDELIIDEAQKALVRRLTPEKIAEVKEVHSEIVQNFTAEMDKVLTDLENKPSGTLVDASIVAVKGFKEKIDSPSALGDIALSAVALSDNFLVESILGAVIDDNLTDVFTDFDNIDHCASLGIRAEEIAFHGDLVVEDVEEYLRKKNEN